MATDHTMHFIGKKLEMINAMLGTPKHPWTTDGNGKPVPAVGCIFLDNAYGAYSIRQMVETSGERAVVTSGYFNKREIMLQLEGFYQGLIYARDRQAAQVS